MEEVGALEASCPEQAVRGVVARYRADDDLAALTDVWPANGGQVMVEPLAGAPDGDAADVTTYKCNWYADDEEVCVWPVEE